MGRSYGLNDDAISTLFEDNKGTIWAVTVRTAFKLRPGQTQFEHVSTPFRIRRLAEDRMGTLWFSSADRGVGKLDDSFQGPLRQQLERLSPSDVFYDGRGNCWISTLGQGLWRLSSGRQEDEFRLEHLDGATLTSASIRSTFEDREGNIWLGTQNGLDKLSERSPVQMSNDQVSRSIRAVAVAADGKIWAATEDGIYRFWDGIDHFDHFGESSGLPNSTVNALYAGSSGDLLATTFGGAVLRFNGKRFEPVLPAGVASGSIWAFTSDAEGTLWLCESFKNLTVWMKGTHRAVDPFPGDGNICSAALTDSRGRVWIGFADGRVLVRADGAFQSYTATEGLAGGSVEAIAEDANGRIWVGSKEGLSRIGVDGHIAAVRGRTDTPIANVRGITFDQSGNVWLGVSSGILRLDPRQFEQASRSKETPLDYTLYDTADGLRGLPMSPRGYPTAARSGDGMLWFVTSDGLAVVDPKRLVKAAPVPPVIIESVRADGQSFAPNQTLSLKPLTSTIQIDYTALTFANPFKTRFRYKLEGFDADWVDAGTRRQAYYTNLPPRSYVFQVITGTEGAWDGPGARWSFSIRPAFYQRGWFYVGITVAFIIFILGAWRIRTERIRQQFALVLAERSRVARDIHDTLLQSLVGLAFQFDALEGDLDVSPVGAKKRLQRLRVQVSMHIRDFRQSIAELRSDAAQTLDLPNGLQNLATGWSEDGISCTFKIQGTPSPLPPRTDLTLLRVAQEAASNAVRHGPANQIDIELDYFAESVVLRIIDNGCGFDVEAQAMVPTTHWGLAIMKERTRQVGGRISVTSTAGVGTTVEVNVPLSTLNDPRGRA